MLEYALICFRMLKCALRQTCAMNGVAISQWCGYFRKWCGYFIMVWLFHFGVAIYENGVAISFSTSRAPCRSQKPLFFVQYNRMP